MHVLPSAGTHRLSPDSADSQLPLDQRRWMRLAWRRWHSAPNTLALAALVLTGLGVRLWVLGASGELGADEAIPGLMARHIAAGRELPVFYYGQNYFGAAEAYLIAALFFVFGFQPGLVVVPAVAASLALIPLTWALGEHLAPRPAGLVAALLVSLPPPALTRLFANAGGGFSLSFALQSAALLCCIRAYRGGPGATRWAALFWLSVGFAGWVWQPALIALPPLYVPVLIRNPSLRQPAALVRTLAWVAIGLIPPVAYNALQGWPTLSQLTRYTNEAQADDGWRVLLLALGGGDEGAPTVNRFLVVVVSVAFALTPAVLVARARGIRSEKEWRQRLDAVVILLMFTMFSALAAHQAVRHLVPIVLVGYVLAGAMLTLVPARAPFPPWVPSAAVAVVLGAGSLQLQARAPEIFPHETPSTTDVVAVLAALDQRGLRTGYADYWSAYPVTYLSGERIILAPELPPRFSGRVDRYPAYAEQVDAVDNPTAAFALVDRACELGPYVHSLERLGATYRIDAVARWWLVWDIHPRTGLERETLDAWRRALQARQTCE